MDLRLNEDQSMMKKVAADFVKSEAPSYVITDWFQKKIAFIPEVYQKTAKVGWRVMWVVGTFVLTLAGAVGALIAKWLPLFGGLPR